ncbi:MAG: hypothetical protein IJ481_01740 [Alphaproteobacteria bacterium]|nr:hypothetical protein [Alphaproteobacteria bacterium]
MFNRSTSNSHKYWIAYNKVTINEYYTLNLITTGYDDYYYVLDCYNIFTNNGNVIIDGYGELFIDYINTIESNPISDSINDGTIDVKNGWLTLYDGAILNNKGTITLTGSSYIYINTNTAITNKGTIDISNITDLSYWSNAGTFKLEGGSTFILPKSIPTNKIGSAEYTFKPITLNGSSNNKVIFKYYTHEPYIDNNNIKIRSISDAETYNSLEDITIKTEFTFTGSTSNVSFIPTDKYTLSDIASNSSVNTTDNTLSLPQEGIDPVFDKDSTVNFNININTPISFNTNTTVNFKGRVSFNNTTIRLNGGNITSTYPINLIGSNTIDMCNKDHSNITITNNNIRFNVIKGISFTGNISNLKFININSSSFIYLSNILSSPSYNSPKYTLDISQLGIIPTIKDIDTIDTKLIIPEGYTLTVTGNIKVNSIWDVKGTINSNNNITYTKGSSSNVKGGNIRSSIRTKGGKIVFK